MLQYCQKQIWWWKGWRPLERSKQIKGLGWVGPSRRNKHWIRRGHRNRNNSLCQARVGSRSGNTLVKHWNDEQDKNCQKTRTKKLDCISHIHNVWWGWGEEADHTVRIWKNHSKSRRRRRYAAKCINQKNKQELPGGTTGCLQLKQQCYEKRGLNGWTSIRLRQNRANFIINHLKTSFALIKITSDN